MTSRWILLALGIYMLIVGLLAVTNIQVQWSGPIAGFAAIVTGLLCLFAFFTRQAP